MTTAFQQEHSKKQVDDLKKPDSSFKLNLSSIIDGKDTRTTVMIKNIPNKYTQKMLLQKINENHRGEYDFLYLPIDFKNKCNVGYAFINFVDSLFIVNFCEELNDKKWERFNSEKICEITYGRIQGKHALVDHFETSNLWYQNDKRVRPLILNVYQPSYSFLRDYKKRLQQDSSLNLGYIKKPSKWEVIITINCQNSNLHTPP